MIRVAILLVAFVLLFLLYKKFKDNKNLNKEITIISLVLLGLIITHEHFSNQTRQKVTKLLIAFKEGKTLVCHDKKIDKNTFEYESGTMVFISKKLGKEKYSITECKR